jgi:hypothetical protein
MPSTRPQPEHYRTRSEYVWARRNWKRAHGGSLLVTLAIAFVFGAWSGSHAALLGLVAFAIVATAIARSRP